MAKKKNKGSLPTYKEKQALLFAKEIKTDELIKMGRIVSENGGYNDAISFFSKAGYQEGLEDIKQKIVDQGDVFLFKRILKEQDKEADPDEWKKIADNANLLDKLLFAREAYRMAGDFKSMDKVSQRIDEDNSPAEETVEDQGDE
jgi:hypothetical protein